MRKNTRTGLSSGSGNAERRSDPMELESMHEQGSGPMIGHISGKAGGAIGQHEAVSLCARAVRGTRAFCSQSESLGVAKMRFDKALRRPHAASERDARSFKPRRTFAGFAPKLLFLPFSVLLVAASPQQEETAPASEGSLQLRCMVNGYDVVLINDGAEEIPVGTVVGWSVPAARIGSDYTLTRPLGASESRFLTAVLGSNYMNPRSECQVQIRPPA